MKFHSTQVKGAGRGKTLGFPTINLEIPANFELAEGIYASLVNILGKTYKGALFFGSVPTFNQVQKNLEVYLINLKEDLEKFLGDIEIEIKDKIREVQKFESEQKLIEQMEEDVEKINLVLKKYSS